MKSVKMTEISVEHGNPGRNVIFLVFESLKGLDLEDKLTKLR